MADIGESVKELWHKYPVVVIAVAGGAVLLVVSQLGKGQKSQAPNLDGGGTGTYNIGGTSGGTGSGVVPTPTPVQEPSPGHGFNPGFTCADGYHRGLDGGCIPDTNPGPTLPPVPIHPGPPPRTCGEGYHLDPSGSGQCLPDSGPGHPGPRKEEMANDTASVFAAQSLF